MHENKTEHDSHDISRRKFLAGAGVVLGGTVAGAGILLSACNGENIPETVTVKSDRLLYVCPYDGKTFESIEELRRYISEKFPGQGSIPIEEGMITLDVNGMNYSLHVKDNWSLAFVLREKLGLPGTKIGCGRGSCGSCTVIVDGKTVLSCLTLAVEANGKYITTIEGLSDGINLDPVQQAFVAYNAAQCGYCTPGFIMSARALLNTNPTPTREDVREALSGHLCICGHTKKIVDAVLSASASV